MNDAICDTTVLIDLLRSHRNTRREAAIGVIAAAPRLITTTITVAELAIGITASPTPETAQRALSNILSDFHILDFDLKAAREYGNLVAALRRQGDQIGVADAMIAAIAVSHRAAVITRNVRHFNRIPNLKLISY